MHNQPRSPTNREVAIGLLALSAPIIATNISRTAMSFIDFVMVSRLGTDAQAAIVPAGLVLWCLISFGMGIASVVNTFVSQSLGRGDHAGCAAYAWQGLHISLALGVILLPTWFLIEPFFQWANHGPSVIPKEVDYTRIGLLGVVPTIAAMVLSNFFTGIHRPAVGFVAALIGNAFNVVANYALIFGHWGFPAMGIAGAAWATLAASVLSAAILLLWLLLPHYARTYHSLPAWRPDGPRLLDLIRIGSPQGIQYAADIGAWTIFTVFLVGRFGEHHLAANNICMKFIEVSFMPAVGIGMALTASVGKSIGQGRRDLARRYTRWCMFYCVGYMGLIGLIMALFRYELPALLTNDDQVIHWAGPIMIMCAVFQVFDALAITMNGVLRGAGDMLWQAVAWMASALVFLLGGGYAMAHFLPQWASTGVWIAATVHMVVIGILLWIRYAFGPWERINLSRTSRLPNGGGPVE